VTAAVVVSAVPPYRPTQQPGFPPVSPCPARNTIRHSSRHGPAGTRGYVLSQVACSGVGRCRVHARLTGSWLGIRVSIAREQCFGSRECLRWRRGLDRGSKRNRKQPGRDDRFIWKPGLRSYQHHYALGSFLRNRDDGFGGSPSAEETAGMRGALNPFLRLTGSMTRHQT
jgi:hypothetical protein